MVDSRELLRTAMEARDGNRAVTAAGNGRQQWRSSSVREAALAHDLSGDALAAKTAIGMLDS
jgi:hypothetical protein